MALTDNLIAFWELEEASGTRVDAHGTNDLTDNNTVLQGTGKVVSCADFERDNTEYLSRADNADLSTGDIDFTIAAWVTLESFTAAHTVWGKWGSTNGVREYWLYCWTNLDRFQFTVQDGDGAVNADALGAPSTGTWYFIVCWHDATANTVNIQVNNGTVNSVSYSFGIVDTTAPFHIGANAENGSNHHWDGLIDQVGFWKRVLTADERTELYNSGNGLSYAAMSGGAADQEPSLVGGKLIGRSLLLGHLVH
jgi:hypothetical protein